MKSRWFLVVLIPLLVVVLSACSTKAPTTIGDSLSEGELKSEDNIHTEPDSGTGEGTLMEEDSPTSGNDHNGVICEDPFEGRSPRFSTTGWETNFCIHSVPYDEIFSGGPPRDGIPPLDAPSFETIESANIWLEDVEPVIAFENNGEARAYPLQILIWHEIVNDVVGDDPVVVTFCPLCNTALVFARPTINGERLTFGTSGNLRLSDLVMWDRQTQSWWQQFNGEAIVGDLTGTQLEFLPSGIVSWSDFKSKYPDGQVLSKDTGFPRSYGRNPYTGYDSINSFPFLFDGNLNDLLPPMARVLGILLENGEGGAFSLDLLMENLVQNEVLGDTPIAIFWKSGTSSAVDQGTISQGRDVGTTGVFLSTVNDQVLTFSANNDGTFTDEETDSTWDIFGEAVAGPLAGTQLVSLPHHDTFWFAWAAFVPEGSLTNQLPDLIEPQDEAD